MNTIDYTPVILAQLTDLQMRITKQETVISLMRTEIEKLSGKSFTINDAVYNNTMKTSIPLLPKPHYTAENTRQNKHTYSDNNITHISNKLNTKLHPNSINSSHTHKSNTYMSHNSTHSKHNRHSKHTERNIIQLSDILKENETILIEINNVKDTHGNNILTTATAKFDGSCLEVTSCESVSSLIGMKSSKPGEILYKLLDELKTNYTNIKTSNIAPWRLCYVERDGVRKNLEELRNEL